MSQWRRWRRLGWAEDMELLQQARDGGPWWHEALAVALVEAQGKKTIHEAYGVLRGTIRGLITVPDMELEEGEC